MTQVQLAERCGMNQSHISFIEKGMRGAASSKWREIARVLEVKVDWLINDADEHQVIDETWLEEALTEKALPFGMKELGEDKDLVLGLKISKPEWIALKTLKTPVKLTKNGYVGILYAIRNGSHTE